MRRILKIAAVVIGLLVVAGVGFFFFGLAPMVDDSMNKVREKPPYSVS